MAQHIKKLLSPFLQSNNQWKHKLLNNWETIMGKLAQHVTIEKIYPDTLILGVYDSCWLQELYLLSATLLQTINQSLDQPRIKQIRFKQTTRKKTAVPQQKDIPKITSEVTLSTSEESALSRISDESMRAVMKSFLIRCHREREK